MPPGRWFMNIRLNGALRDLLMTTPECRVADVAARWGFRHLPRFAEQYRRAFGELPSQTLSRAYSKRSNEKVVRRSQPGRRRSLSAPGCTGIADRHQGCSQLA
jgi:AraC-like DNA-binding protein